jgi:ABC-type uncharacterized transport system ATPase subunit
METAVDHLSLEIRKGELFGLLKPNGPGKTTVVKILCTLSVFGNVLFRPQVMPYQLQVVSHFVPQYSFSRASGSR